MHRFELTSNTRRWCRQLSGCIPDHPGTGSVSLIWLVSWHRSLSIVLESYSFIHSVTNIPSTLLAAKWPQTMMLPPPCLTVLFAKASARLLQTSKLLCCDQKSQSSSHLTIKPSPRRREACPCELRVDRDVPAEQCRLEIRWFLGCS